MHWQEEVFIPRRVFLFKHVTRRGSTWAMPTLVSEFIHSFKLSEKVEITNFLYEKYIA